MLLPSTQAQAFVLRSPACRRSLPVGFSEMPKRRRALSSNAGFSSDGATGSQLSAVGAPEVRFRTNASEQSTRSSRDRPIMGTAEVHEAPAAHTSHSYQYTMLKEAMQSGAQGMMVDNKGRGAFRFWHDERRFKNPGSACVVQDALFAAGGVRTGGYPKAAPIPGPLGYQRPGDWDMLWSPARLALRAVPSLKPGQLISSSPGIMSLTRKRKLPVTLCSALGDAAWSITPQSFVLPDELPALQEHMASRQAQGKGDELWILKTAQHLGKGLKLLPANEICAEAGKRHACSEGSRRPSKPYVLAQRYVDNPLLVEGRKFGIRVWVLVLGPNPLRAYLHTNGLVLFATHGYDGEAWQGEGGSVGLGHVTNYAQNVDGMVWDLDQLKEHLGQEAFGQLWGNISRSAALMCSAALSHMRAEHAALHVPAESAFELLGLDYLVDTNLHPWLLEVNGTPSLAVDHSQPHVEKLIHKQKSGMVHDMFSLLGVSTRFHARYEAMRLAAKHASSSRRAPAARVPGPTRPVSSSKHSKSRVNISDGDDEEDEEGEGADDEENNGMAAGVAGGTVPGSVTHTAKPVVSELAKSALLGMRLSGSGKGAAVALEGPVFVLPRRVRDQLAPKSEQAIRARVEQELQQRGAFQPLMSLFPMSSSVLTTTKPSLTRDKTQTLDTDTGRDQNMTPSPGTSSLGSSAVSKVGQVVDQGDQQKRHGVQGAGSEGDAAAGVAGGKDQVHMTMQAAVEEALRVAHVPWSVQDVALRRTLDGLPAGKG